MSSLPASPVPIVSEGHGRVRVPDPTVSFWVMKAISTALGEAVSDYSIRVMPPALAVVLGLAAVIAALALKLRRRRYVPGAYWLAVAAVGVFGTMAADVAHVVVGLPYPVSAVVCALLLAGVFIAWSRVEHTLSVHAVDTTRRELFYWAAVIVTFALGTALGDAAAVGLGLGYLASIGVFAALILVPALGYRFGRMNAVLAFWFAYVLTRPLGAAVADWAGKASVEGGLGIGPGWVSLVLALAMAGLVGVAHVQSDDRGTRNR